MTKKFLIGLFVVCFLAALGYRARAQLLGPPSSIPKEQAAMLHRDRLAIDEIRRQAELMAKPYLDEQNEILRENGLDGNDPALHIDYMTGKVTHDNAPQAAPAPAAPPKTPAPTTAPPAGKDARKLPS